MKELEFRQVCALFGCTDARILPFKDKPFKKSGAAPAPLYRPPLGPLPEPTQPRTNSLL